MTMTSSIGSFYQRLPLTQVSTSDHIWKLMFQRRARLYSPLNHLRLYIELYLRPVKAKNTECPNTERYIYTLRTTVRKSPE